MSDPDSRYAHWQQQRLDAALAQATPLQWLILCGRLGASRAQLAQVLGLQGEGSTEMVRLYMAGRVLFPATRVSALLALVAELAPIHQFTTCETWTEAVRPVMAAWVGQVLDGEFAIRARLCDAYHRLGRYLYKEHLTWPDLHWAQGIAQGLADSLAQLHQEEGSA